jgi:hypothetical protein
MDDVPFLDSLQRLHTKQVGWMPTKQFEEKVTLGHVLIAEEKETADCADNADNTNSMHSSVQSAKSVVQPLGYCIGNDQYFKRDDVGIIYQMNVVPAKQRGFIGAILLKAMFDRAAYGCRVVLLLVCAGHRGESVLGVDGVRAAGISIWQREEVADAYLLATADLRGRHDDAVLVPVADYQRGNSRGSAGAADSAGHALERCQADRAAGEWRGQLAHGP